MSFVYYLKLSIMKKIFLLIIAVIHIGVLFAQIYESGGIAYEILSNEDSFQVQVVNNGNFYQGNLVIPEIVNISNIDYAVTAIGDGAFYRCYDLLSIEISNTVTTIGDTAFYQCTNLESVLMPNSVLSIGYASFYLCESLASLIIPASVTDIGDFAFAECYLLSSITLPNSVETLGEAAFMNCFALTDVQLSSSLNSIKMYSFYSCTSIANIVIPDAVETINEGAFMNCTGLYGVDFGDNLTYIGMNAFDSCTNIHHVTIPDNVQIIGAGAFQSCTGMETIIVGNSVTEIQDGTFYDCTSLTTVILGSSIQSIGTSSFYNCSSITSITCCALIPPTPAYCYEFYNVPTNIPFYIPFESIDLYQVFFPYNTFIITGTDYCSVLNQNDLKVSENALVFPNPCSDWVTVDLKEGDEGLMTLYDISGKIILSSEIIGGQKINVESIPIGIYYYIIKNDNFIESGKLVKDDIY